MTSQWFATWVPGIFLSLWIFLDSIISHLTNPFQWLLGFSDFHSIYLHIGPYFLLTITCLQQAKGWFLDRVAFLTRKSLFHCQGEAKNFSYKRWLQRRRLPQDHEGGAWGRGNADANADADADHMNFEINWMNLHFLRLPSTKSTAEEEPPV